MTSNPGSDYPLPPLSAPLRVAGLAARKPTRFDLRPDAAACARIARWLEVSAVSHLTFKGSVEPAGREDFVLRGDLAAQVTQPCGLTLVPVVTRIEEQVIRRYLARMPEPTGDEVEIPEDDSIEPLGSEIDAGHVAAEALALALPLYPRAPGAVLDEAVAAPEGTAPLRDADLRPFAGLAALRDKLAGPDSPEDPADDPAEDPAS